MSNTISRLADKARARAEAIDRALREADPRVAQTVRYNIFAATYTPAPGAYCRNDGHKHIASRGTAA